MAPHKPRRHGTDTMYRNGCRCDECREWNRIRCYRRRLARKGMVPNEHGLNAYRNYGCKCDICTTAAREDGVAYRASRAGKEPPRHGTPTGYHTYKCRCEECCAWYAWYVEDSKRRYRERVEAKNGTYTPRGSKAR